MTFSNINSVLVIKLRHIGDVLLTVPVFRAVKETFPGARVCALVNAGTEDVLRDNPLVDEILVVDRQIKALSAASRMPKEISFLRSISKRGFDMTVDLTGGDRAAILSFASGARYRLGLKPKKGFAGKKLLYTHLAEPDGKSHTVLQNLKIVDQFGISTPDLSVGFHFGDDDKAFVQKTLEDRGIGKDAVIAHVHPTSRWLFKCWTDEFMADVIKWLLDKGIAAVVTTSPDKKEVEKAGRILGLVGRRPHLIDLRGRTTIKQLGALSEASRLFFGVDSAPMHIAAAVGTPVVALFGPSGAFHWGPWDNKRQLTVGAGSPRPPYPNRNGLQSSGRNTVIQRDWACIPCGQDGCRGTKKSRCLEDIRPDEVISVLAEKLKESE